MITAARTILGLTLIVNTMFLFSPSQAFAQDASPRVTNKPAGDDFVPMTDEDIQLLRKDLRSQEKQIIAANMKLTDTEAEKFWPVYEQYISDLVAINGKKYALVKKYVQSRGALSEEESETVVQQWVDVDESVSELRRKYIPSFRKVLSAKKTALFYQLEHHVQLLIDVQLASSLPQIEP